MLKSEAFGRPGPCHPEVQNSSGADRSSRQVQRHPKLYRHTREAGMAEPNYDRTPALGAAMQVKSLPYPPGSALDLPFQSQAQHTNN